MVLCVQMPFTIDSHAHAFPDRLRKLAPALGGLPIQGLRKSARFWMRPFASSMHRAQPWLRLLPEAIRGPVDGLVSLAPLPGLLVESTPPDLAETMDEAKVQTALVIAHPQWIPNEFVMELAAEDPRFAPVVNLPASTDEPAKALQGFVKDGARALKIHPAADGAGPDSEHYRALLRAADELALPVIIHTGCIHSPLLYKDPSKGRAEIFESWFSEHPRVRFVLAHMNFHEPQVAMDLAEKYSNLLLETSWQPAEVIGEAVRRVGARRVLFGSDWPFVGDNLRVGIDRIRDCVETGMFTEAEAALVLGENAAELFKIGPVHAS